MERAVLNLIKLVHQFDKFLPSQALFMVNEDSEATPIINLFSARVRVALEKLHDSLCPKDPFLVYTKNTNTTIVGRFLNNTLAIEVDCSCISLKSASQFEKGKFVEFAGFYHSNLQADLNNELLKKIKSFAKLREKLK